MAHVCLTQQEACGVLTPCPACIQLIFEKVIVPSLEAAQVDETQAKSFFSSYAKNYQGVAMQVLQMMQAQAASTVVSQPSPQAPAVPSASQPDNPTTRLPDQPATRPISNGNGSSPVSVEEKSSTKRQPVAPK